MQFRFLEEERIHLGFWNRKPLNTPMVVVMAVMEAVLMVAGAGCGDGGKHLACMFKLTVDTHTWIRCVVV